MRAWTRMATCEDGVKYYKWIPSLYGVVLCSGYRKTQGGWGTTWLRSLGHQ